jgi:hypothetical protein
MHKPRDLEGRKRVGAHECGRGGASMEELWVGTKGL